MIKVEDKSLSLLLERKPVYFDGDINSCYYNFNKDDSDLFFSICSELEALKTLSNEFRMVNFQLLEEWLANVIRFTRLDVNKKSSNLQMDNLYHTPLSFSLKQGYVNVCSSILDRSDLDINMEYTDISGNRYHSMTVMFEGINFNLFKNGIYKNMINYDGLILNTKEEIEKIINVVINYIDNNINEYVTTIKNLYTSRDEKKRCNLYLECISLLYSILHTFSRQCLISEWARTVIEQKCKTLKREIGYAVERIY